MKLSNFLKYHRPGRDSIISTFEHIHVDSRTYSRQRFLYTFSMSSNKTLLTRSNSTNVVPFFVGPFVFSYLTVSVLLFEKGEYVEPAVNRQPGFRRELVEKITQSTIMFLRFSFSGRSSTYQIRFRIVS